MASIENGEADGPKNLSSYSSRAEFYDTFDRFDFFILELWGCSQSQGGPLKTMILLDFKRISNGITKGKTVTPTLRRPPDPQNEKKTNRPKKS